MSMTDNELRALINETEAKLSALLPLKGIDWEKELKALIVALEAGNYNAAPQPLTNGCVFMVEDEPAMVVHDRRRKLTR